MSEGLRVVPVSGMPDVTEGADIAALIAEASPDLEQDDILVVTQKIVSKAEGRVVAGNKDRWVARETRRIVARRDDLVIAETRHGFVCASAGVDESNVGRGLVSLLPEDPDGSAARIRQALRERTGVGPAVLITDTFGRPWRRGLVNVAIGSAGLPALVDLRGTPDMYGRPLEVTVVALADEVAAAAGLVMGKAEGVPVAVVRGLQPKGSSGSAADLIRPAEEDLFRYAPLTAIETRRTIREFGSGAVPQAVLQQAVAAALTAPVPHGSRHPMRPWMWVVLESRAGRARLLERMAEAWVRDMRGDGTPDDVIERRLRRSDELLGQAPVLAMPNLSLAHADDYPDERRRQAERDMFLLATGAGVQNFMLALHAQGFASAWVSSSLFCKDESREGAGLDPGWLPMGVVACGPPPEGSPPPRPPLDPARHLRLA
jgi:coenzyme F420-0:L-glutamate ligase / coenzyme F420-1:gamma-L-glutamate ligase